MEKACPYCSHVLTKSDYRLYLKKQSSDMMECAKCSETFYIVVPEANRMKMGFLNFLAVLPIIAMSFGAVALVFLYGGQLFDSETSRFDVRVVGLVGFGFFVALCFAAAMAFRAIQWKFAVAQKSPFT